MANDTKWKNHLYIWLMPLGYGLITRLFFGLFDASGGDAGFSIVGLAFIGLTPIGMGYLTAYFLYRAQVKQFGLLCMLLPIGVVSVGFLLAVVTYLEAAVCAVMALPIGWVAAFIGGVIGHLVYRKRRHHEGMLQLSFVVLLPYLISPIESLREQPTVINRITNTMDFEAPVDVVWKNIASVDPIPAADVPNKWIYWIGFPKPISANISEEGVGGIRTAVFEKNVTFHEVVTIWEPEREIAFTIKADPEFVPATAFDRHIIVGGRFFDVLNGHYVLEQLPNGSTRVHLTSRHRLSTSFNVYAAWWSERIMFEIQDSIMQALKKRCELQAEEKSA